MALKIFSKCKYEIHLLKHAFALAFFRYLVEGEKSLTGFFLCLMFCLSETWITTNWRPFLFSKPGHR